MELKVNGKTNCYQFSQGMIKQIQEQISVSQTLQPGVHHLSIKTGTFSYSQDQRKAIPTLNLWIYGKFINVKVDPEVIVDAGWFSLNGYSEVLNIEVLEPTTVCCLFFDTYAQDNTGEVTLYIKRVEPARVEPFELTHVAKELLFKFDHLTTKYSRENAYWLSRMAELAYMRISQDNPAPNQPLIYDTLKSYDNGFSDVETFNAKSSQGFVAKHQKIIVVSFRGTDQIVDWLDNTNFMQHEISLGRVHKGFYFALQDIWQDMQKTIKKYRDNGQSLWITGHSLGGALASLAAIDLVEQDQPFNGTYTFGQPRCCDRKIARIMNVEAKSRLYRFHNQNDIIPRMPQRSMGYSHLGTFVYIDKDKKLSSNVNWWYQFTDAISGTWEAIREQGLDYIRDHDMKNYVEALHTLGEVEGLT